MVITGTVIMMGLFLLGGIVIGAAVGTYLYSQYQTKNQTLSQAQHSKSIEMSDAVAFSEQPAPFGTAPKITQPVKRQVDIESAAATSSDTAGHDLRGLHNPSGHYKSRRF